jgi:hypothetical protein
MITSSQEVNTPVVRPTGFPVRQSTIFRLSLALVFATALALAPAPAFAQHGGGGGGGGGSHGGGGGGGSHGGGGGGGGHASGGSGGGGSHAGAMSAPSGGSGSHGSATGAGGNNNSGGHWWNPFHSGSSEHANSASGSAKPGSNPSAEHYAAGNNTWQDPPATAGHTSAHAPPSGARPTGPQKNPTNGAIPSTRGAVAGPPHVFPPHHPGRPYYPYYPYYFSPYYGFGWGGGLWWGGFYPCDPFWGCYGYGYGYGYGGGYGYYGGSFGGNYSADLSYDSSNDWSASQEPNPSLYAAPSSDAGQSSGDSTSQQQPYVILYLKDGSSYAVSDYWLFGGKLHYITSYGGENMIDQSQLDLQRTVNENAARGVDFTLRPEPAGNGETAPVAPAPDTNPPPPQQ